MAAASTANRYDMADKPVAWLELPVKAAVHIYKGTHVCVDTTVGGVCPAADSANFEYIGQAENEADNSAGLLGAIKVRVKPLCMSKLKRMNAVSPTATWLGKRVCFVNDNTVALIATTTSDVTCGRVVRIDNTTSTGSVIVDVTDRNDRPVAA